jgi:predicted phage tail protein
LFKGRENRNGVWTHRWKVQHTGETTYRAVVWRSNGARRVGTTTTMTVVVPDTAPATPTNFVATPADGSATLTWDPVQADDLASYKVQYSSTPDAWITIDDVPPGSESGYTVPGLSNGIEYQFRVAAVDNAGNASSFTSPMAATPSP